MYIKGSDSSDAMKKLLTGVEVGDNNIALSIDHQGFHIETNGRWTGTLDELTFLLDKLATLANESVREMENDKR